VSEERGGASKGIENDDATRGVRECPRGAVAGEKDHLGEQEIARGRGRRIDAGGDLEIGELEKKRRIDESFRLMSEVVRKNVQKSRKET